MLPHFLFPVIEFRRFFLPQSSNLTFYKFFSVFSGDYSLEISNVALEDDAVFQCQVGALDSVHGIRSRSASFTVQVPPEAPVIVVTHAHSHAQVVQSSSGAAGSAANSGLVMTQGTPTQGNVSSNGGEMLVSAGSGASLTSSSSNPSNLDHHLRTTAGMTIELTCEAHGGRPPAEVSRKCTFLCFCFQNCADCMYMSAEQSVFFVFVLQTKFLGKKTR